MSVFVTTTCTATPMETPLSMKSWSKQLSITTCVPSLPYSPMSIASVLKTIPVPAVIQIFHQAIFEMVCRKLAENLVVIRDVAATQVQGYTIWVTERLNNRRG